MSTTTTPAAETPVPQPPPHILNDPDALVAWAMTPEGAEFFRRSGMALMEQRVNAEREGKPAPVATTVNPYAIPTLTRETAGEGGQ